MNRSFKIGLTGGIASGKTTVANLFSNLGIEIIDADAIAHSITSKQGSAYNKIVKLFGEGILGDDKKLDRKKLRTMIFNNSELKRDLEQIIHPEVYAIINQKINASIETQLARLINRDDETMKNARKIIANQIERNERLKFADDIIENEKKTPINVLKNKVLQLHETYLELSEKSLI